jgi:RNA polymerase sigma-70 factor (ECF subfamily)
MEALRQGDETAFDALFRSWYAPLVRYASGFTDGDVDEAEDLVQQAFVKLWEQRGQLEVQHSLKAYLYRMVHNLALNRLRSARSGQRYAEHQLRQMEHAHVEPPSGDELPQRLQKALDLLPPQCRAIFELSRFEELKYREIAEQLGISIKTVETQMGRALKTLRRELADCLVGLAGLFFLLKVLIVNILSIIHHS